jgi:hypothetical protein
VVCLGNDRGRVVGALPFIGFVAIVPGRILWLLISGVIMLRRAGSTEPATETGARPSPMPA